MEEIQKQPLEETKVEQIDVDIDSLFGTPSDSIMLPEEKEEKKSVFTASEKVDLSFIDTKEQKETPEEKIEIQAAIDELDDMITKEEEGDKKGRPKTDKSGLLELASKMIEEGSLIPFDDEKPLEEYTAKDFRELFEANFTEKENKIREELPHEFFKSLPEELQIAAKYVADGGQDLKGLFRTLAHVEEVFELDPSVEDHQAEIARQYLHATRFGTPEEIEAEIEDWIDMNKLEQKAKQFKPKLDKMQEEIVASRLAEQEQKKQQQQKAAEEYMDNVYTTLSTGELGGIKLDKKVQNMLYSGLVQPSYSSVSGKQTNLLGHLLEKYQFVEPRHDLIAEALWLLADPDGYKSKLQEIGKTEEVQKTVRTLKTESSRKLASSSPQEEEFSKKPEQGSKRTLPRNQGNIFKRF